MHIFKKKGFKIFLPIFYDIFSKNMYLYILTFALLYSYYTYLSPRRVRIIVPGITRTMRISKTSKSPEIWWRGFSLKALCEFSCKIFKTTIKMTFPKKRHWEMNSSYFPPTFEFSNSFFSWFNWFLPSKCFQITSMGYLTSLNLNVIILVVSF